VTVTFAAALSAATTRDPATIPDGRLTVGVVVLVAPVVPELVAATEGNAIATSVERGLGDVSRAAICAPQNDTSTVSPTAKLEVRRCVVRAVAVDVMNRLVIRQWPPESSSEHETMLGDIPLSVGHREREGVILSRHHVDVTTQVEAPTLPQRVPGSV